LKLNLTEPEMFLTVSSIDGHIKYLARHGQGRIESADQHIHAATISLVTMQWGLINTPPTQQSITYALMITFSEIFRLLNLRVAGG